MNKEIITGKELNRESREETHEVLEKDNVDNPLTEIKDIDVENISEKKVEEIEDNLISGAYINDEELSESHHEIADKISLDWTRETMNNSKSSILEKIRKFNSTRIGKAIKVFVISASLFLKANSLKAKTDEKIGKNKGLTEKEVSRKDNKKLDEKTFDASEMLASNLEIATLDISKSFETDKADISRENYQTIENKVHTFLSHLNHNNFEKLIKNKWQIEASADQRKTNYGSSENPAKYAHEDNKVGNEALALDRGLSGKEAFIQAVKDYKGLSEEEKQLIIDKINNDMEVVVANSEKQGGEKGVTLITQLINPETGNNYTNEEINNIKKNNPDEYNKLLSQCRYVKIDLQAIGADKAIEMEKKEVKPANILKVSPDNFKGVQSVVFALDNSPSMSDDYKKMSEDLNNLALNEDFNNKASNLKDIKVVGFCSEIEEKEEFRNGNPKDLMTKAAKALENIKIGKHIHEKAIDVVINLVKEMKEDGKKEIFVGTDELLQSVSLQDMEQLNSLAKEKHINFNFYLKPRYVLDKNYNVVSLDKEYFNVNLEKVVKSVKESYEQEKKSITDRIKQIENILSSKKVITKKKSLKKELESLKSRLTNLDSKQYNLSSIELDDGRTLHW